MSTDKPRIQVTLDEQTAGLLALMADKTSSSRSAVAADLIRRALELQEDLYFSKLADGLDSADTEWAGDTPEIWD